MAGDAVEMHMTKSDDELEGKRKQRNARTQLQARSRPIHGFTLYASTAMPQNEP
jgi:hypothetical protein